ELVARMEWIAQQEGITADAEVLGVLAQAGEGSVRDSLSALDQAIACCGNVLRAAEVRELLGMFSLDSLEQVAKALAAADAQKMFDIVAELESNGRSLQHFARELARYFRNLLVIRIAKGPTKLVAASAPEQQKLAEAGAPFSEEDLTRYLQLALDLFRDLQNSLQPRFHLEMGLVRMVHAGRLQAIEQALAGLEGAGGTGASRGPSPSGSPVKSAAPRLTATNVAVRPAANPVAPVAGEPAALAGGDFRTRLHAALTEQQLTHIADAVAHSSVEESASEVVITAPKMYQMFFKQKDLEAAVRRVAGRAVRITVKIGEPGSAGAPAAAGPTPPLADSTLSGDEVTARALENPEVKRFRETFPDSQVRTVRNLRDR
ncbi:MAG TPA: DNA polymerase III subunit gamma/tau, partial [Bryobacteraceae bacterium]|nr:DNA polymerase III subunit gamma/tau [Bryobacteraceae bacterium]